MSTDNTAAKSDALQFDRALSANAPSSAGVTCANCKAAITTEYFHVGGHTVCARCRNVIEASVATPRGVGPLLKAGGFGIGAAIAGAIVYYGVIAITNFEIGIVAILIGYMVGYMVRKGAGGRGGRRFQILALVLTYWAVGLAYSPIVMKGMFDKEAKKVATASADSVRAQRGDRLATPAASDSGLTSDTASGVVKSKARPKMTGRIFLLGLGAILFLTFTLPVLVVLGSLPSGLISALIIGIGLRQAWHMTATPRLNISGPYKVGAGPAAAPA
jgi:hypothetical protein